MIGPKKGFSRAAKGLIPSRLRRRFREFAEEQVLGYPLRFVRKRNAELDVTLDLVLASYRRTKDDVFFLQVGAFDGTSGDPLSPLIEKHSLTGVLVEPQREFFDRLCSNYARFGPSRFTFVNAAVGAKDGTSPLYKIKPWPNAPEWVHQHASFDRDTVMKLRNVIPHVESLIEVEHVRSLTFTTLFKEIGREQVDLLQIDAEGYDAELLRLFDIPRRKPAIVRFEHINLNKQDQERCLTLLVDQGYRIAICGADTLAYLPQ